MANSTIFCKHCHDDKHIDDFLLNPDKIINKVTGGLYSALICLATPFVFAFLLILGLFSGSLWLSLFSVLVCAYGIIFSVIIGRKKNVSEKVKVIAYLGGAINAVGSLVLIHLFTFTHSFGPYTGQVVDKVTGEPIAGVVIAMEFSESIPTTGVNIERSVYTAEMLTNTKGEFSVPSQRFFKFNPLSEWGYEYISFFKPGYDCDSFYTLKKNQSVTIELEKLKTNKKRHEDSCYYYGDTIAQFYIASRYQDENEIEMGLKPDNLKNYYQHQGLLKSNERTIYDYPNHRQRMYRIIKYNPIINDNENSPIRLSKITKKGIRIGISPGERFYEREHGPGKPAYIVDYYDSVIKNELYERLRKEEIEFIFDKYYGTVIFLNDDKFKIDDIINKIDNKLNMLFLSKEKKDIFVALLNNQNIPYLLRTFPKAVGYEVLWDHENKDKAEELKLIFFNQIINENLINNK